MYSFQLYPFLRYHQVSMFLFVAFFKINVGLLADVFCWLHLPQPHMLGSFRLDVFSHICLAGDVFGWSVVLTHIWFWPRSSQQFYLRTHCKQMSLPAWLVDRRVTPAKQPIFSVNEYIMAIDMPKRPLYSSQHEIIGAVCWHFPWVIYWVIFKASLWKSYQQNQEI